MKTVLEWLNELPEPYKTQAIENADDEVLSDTADSLREATYRAFVWDGSPQGHGYWRDLTYSLDE